MKNFSLALVVFVTLIAHAEDKMKMNFKNAELTTIIENYSKATGQKFVVDSTVRGTITIFNQSDVLTADAFNQLSEALALNGYAIVTNGDVMTVRNARSAQRDNLEVFTNTVPAAKPQKMVTWIVSLKYIAAMDVQQQLRLLTSAYGEMSAYQHNNQIVISDWTSNIQRIAATLKTLDVPADASVSKIVAKARTDRMERDKYRAHFEPKPEAPKEKSDN